MISTFCLTKTCNWLSVYKDNKTFLQPFPNGFASINNLLLEGIKWAVENDDDVILFVLNPLNQLLEYELLEKSIQIASSNDIHLLYIQNNCIDEIRLTNYFIMENNLIDVDAFLITKALFSPINQLLKELDEDIDKGSLTNLLKLICPYNFVLNPKLDFTPIENKIVLITPFRNAKDFLQQCINSVAQQNYRNYEHILLDDHSDDGGLETMKEEEKIIIKKNTTRKFAIRNIVDELMSSKFEDDDIICFLDGDDTLAHNYVLNIINSAYNNYGCSMTYGGMSIMNSNGVITDKYSCDEFLILRRAVWKAFHFRTFRYRLFKKVINQDPELYFLKDEDSNFLKMPYDMAILFPLMEVSGYEKIKHISASLYRYRLHDNNDHILARSDQRKGENIIRNKSTFNIINCSDIKIIKRN